MKRFRSAASLALAVVAVLWLARPRGGGRAGTVHRLL